MVSNGGTPVKLRGAETAVRSTPRISARARPHRRRNWQDRPPKFSVRELSDDHGLPSQALPLDSANGLSVAQFAPPSDQ